VAASKISSVHELLIAEYGRPQWHPRAEPLSELIGTILSQNTSDVNSSQAFGNLMTTFGSFEAIQDAPVEAIAQAIKSGGLAQVKAPRIKHVLQAIAEQAGGLNLDFLRGWDVTRAKKWLLSLSGVGPKTAACVLLFSLGKPALPVDTHVHRVSQRLGLIPPRVTAERAHQLLEEMLAPAEVYPFHLGMIAHGRRICRARKPRCSNCVLRRHCDYYWRNLPTTGPVV
jgi:endonuclease-3